MVYKNGDNRKMWLFGFYDNTETSAANYRENQCEIVLVWNCEIVHDIFLLKATRFQKNFTPNIPTDISFLDSFGLLEKLKRTVRLFESHLRNALRFTTFSWQKLSWTIALDQWAHGNSVSYCKNSFWTIRAFTVCINERS